MATTDESVGGGYSPSYRDRDIDDTLDDHEQRLSRLEKASFIGLGYVAASAPDIATTLLGII